MGLFKRKNRAEKDAFSQPDESRSPVRPFSSEAEEEREIPRDPASGVILARHKYCPFCIREIVLAATKCPDCKRPWPGYQLEFALNVRNFAPIVLPLLVALVLFNGATVGRTAPVAAYAVSASWEAEEYTQPEKLVIDYQAPAPVRADLYRIFAGQGATDKVSKSSNSGNASYIVNINTGKFHVPGCWHISQMNEENKRAFSGSYSQAIDQGLIPCKDCIG